MMEKENRGLSFLYETAAGRCFLKILTQPWISRLAGKFLDSRLSKPFIPRFIKKHGIAMAEFEKKEYQSFNEFFTRRLLPGSRTLDMTGDSLVSPCDGILNLYELDEECVIPAKYSRYRTEELLEDRKLAERYRGGWCLVFRLRPSDYHRYCYVDDGEIVDRKQISGVLHCVRPIALEKYPVYVRNSREYTVLNTVHFGRVVQMEIGALLVGRITNHRNHLYAKRGMEKGYFEFGGSTIILLVEKDRFTPEHGIWVCSKLGYGAEVKQGEKVGERSRKAV